MAKEHVDTSRLKIPNHLAIIMDGNGRWAQERGYPRYYGHIRGSTRTSDIIDYARTVGIKALTLYAFSTENWKRPEAEVQIIFKLLSKYLKRQLLWMKKNNIRFEVIGDISKLPESVIAVIQNTKRELKSNTGMFLNLAINYGSRSEIILAVKKMIESKIAAQDLNDSKFEEYLGTSHLNGLSDVDLLVRSSGEQRISNFLLWQAAYAEFVFLDTPWPEFTPQSLFQALEIYSQRDRRYGGVKK